MTLETWALFAATETLLCLTPGPAVLLVVGQGLRYGTGASLLATAGILGGNVGYFAIAATGVGAMLVASYELFATVRSAAAPTIEPPSPPTRGRAVLNGFVLQAANPKALVFFTALLPQFIDPHGGIAAQVLVLAVTSVAIGAPA